MTKKQLKKQASRKLSPMQKMFIDAIDFDALHKALSDPVSAAEINAVIKKIKL